MEPTTERTFALLRGGVATGSSIDRVLSGLRAVKDLNGGESILDQLRERATPGRVNEPLKINQPMLAILVEHGLTDERGVIRDQVTAMVIASSIHESDGELIVLAPIA